MNITKDKSWKRLLSVVVAGFAFFGLPERAEAQEILLTGPLAGAPAVRKLRLYREGRFEIAPAVSFTLLDEYQRTILLGARLTYNLTDWFGIGAWGAYGALIRIPTSLTDHIQEVNQERRSRAGYEDSVTGLILAPNLGADLEEQIGGIEWVAAPQLTFTPFRGKIALFQSIYIDTDLYISAGPAFISVKERENCKKGQCAVPLNQSFEQATRTAIAPTAALGLTFYAAKWAAIGVEYRALPFAWNKGGFDTAGGGKDKEFPDGAIDENDRRFGLTNMITVSFNAYLPTQYRVSE
jgi:outer membrane beta-barrel protein